MSPNATTNSGSYKEQESVCIITNGCTEGRMDSALLEHFFKQSSDFRLCKDCIKADLIVFVGCSATEDKEFLSRLIIKSLRSKKRQDAQILVTGCIAKIYPELAYDGDKLKINIADRGDVGDKMGALAMAVYGNGTTPLWSNMYSSNTQQAFEITVPVSAPGIWVWLFSWYWVPSTGAEPYAYDITLSFAQ